MKEDFSAYPDVRKFLQYLAVEKNTSALTVKNYGADIAVFIEFLALTGMTSACPISVRTLRR